MASSGSSGSKKRKRDSTDTESELHRKKKSAWDDWSEKTLKPKEQVHNISSSDEENVFKTPSKSKLHKKEHNKSNSVTLTHTGQLNGEFNSVGDQKQSTKSKKHKNQNDSSFSESEIHVNKLLNSEASSVYENPSSDEGGVKDFGNISTSKSRVLVENGDIVQSVGKVFLERNFTHKDEKEISKFSPLLDEDLFRKYDFWVLQCPKSMDCKDLVGQTLDLSGSGSCELEVDDNLFEAYSYSDSSERSATLAVPSFQNQFTLCRVPIKGNIIIEESVAVKNIRSFRIPEQHQCVELPQNLKIRHPLLGLNYEKQLKTTLIREVSKKKKKKRHSKLSDRNLDSGLDSDSYISTSRETPRKKKKKHSISHEDFVNNEPLHQIDDDNFHGEVKKKKHKKKKKKDDIYDESC